MWSATWKLSRSRKILALSNLARGLSINEPFKSYKFDSPEKKKLDEALHNIVSKDMHVPGMVGIEPIFSGDSQIIRLPHNHQKILGRFCYCNRTHISTAFDIAMETKNIWRNMDVAERANIWRRCADIIANVQRYKLNAAIMLSQSKTYLQAEEDTYQLIVSLRENADTLEELAQTKIRKRPGSTAEPHFQLRPLDGFVAAIGTFTMASVSADTALRPALMGNCVLWKPSNFCVLSSYIIYQALLEAGLPPGVISFVPCNPVLFVDCITRSHLLAGINFIGRLSSVHTIWQDVFFRLHNFQTLPRLVAICGGKNYHFVHESANLDVVIENTITAAFDYAGQKRTACSRLYVPESLWPQLKKALQLEVNAIKVGDPCDFSVRCCAIIHERAFDRIVVHLNNARKNPNVDIVAGGDSCKTLGYFIEPTVLQCKDPRDSLMTEEVFGPVLSVFVYANGDLDATLDLVEETSKYANTGAIFVNDEKAKQHLLVKLRMTAGSIFINAKCSGSLEGQAPFSGNRLAGSNDYPGPPHHLLRWSGPQLIEEHFPGC